MTDTLNERNRKGFLRNHSKMLDDDGNLVANEHTKADGNIKGKKVQESRTLTELSKGTLKSYIIKALDSKDAEYHASDDAFNRSQEKSNSKEYRGKQLALSKFHVRKYDRRNKGIKRATDKFLSKEDVEYAVSQLTEEQTYNLFLDIIYEHSVEDAEKFLTEISKTRLRQYGAKAGSQISNIKYGRDNHPDNQMSGRKVNNRVKGLKLASDKVYGRAKVHAKEDVEQIENIDPNEVYMTESEFKEFMSYLLENYNEDDVVGLLHEWAGASKTMKKAKVVGKKAVRKLKKYMNDTDG